MPRLRRQPSVHRHRCYNCCCRNRHDTKRLWVRARPAAGSTRPLEACDRRRPRASRMCRSLQICAKKLWELTSLSPSRSGLGATDNQLLVASSQLRRVQQHTPPQLRRFWIALFFSTAELVADSLAVFGACYFTRPIRYLETEHNRRKIAEVGSETTQIVSAARTAAPAAHSASGSQSASKSFRRSGLVLGWDILSSSSVSRTILDTMYRSPREYGCQPRSSAGSIRSRRRLCRSRIRSIALMIDSSPTAARRTSDSCISTALR